MIVERVIIVEYLDPSMSRGLLSKFPDNSAFDFDYSQSGIWSPLLPHGNCSTPNSPVRKRRRLEKESEKMLEDEFKKVNMKLKKSLNSGSPLFDFDHSQSGIWSPLVRHGHCSISATPVGKRRKVADGLEKILEDKFKMVNMKIKKSFTKKKGLDFSESPVQKSAPRKGWSKMLRAATKRFKKQKGSSLQIKLPLF
ncbi:uncharacterized protein LOC143883331 [Tasmannia lanceolata]|uniref:uncharacterized protein LOC143883331 n=1 Tax=Tasmannia lanceolata TaxID=3420 RepID=UPI004063AD0E